jgi:arginine:agmatine antiporter
MSPVDALRNIRVNAASSSAGKRFVSTPGRKMSLTQATMLVAGNMIGTGVFLLPVNLAHVGGIAIFGWLVATAGVAALGLAFAKLGELSPQQGGPYAYARDFLGP